jgi:isopenicillin N synthase-like dioxygenase
MFDRVHVPFHSNLAIWHVKPTVNRASSCLGRQVVGTYSKEARALALRLLEAISESLGLERSHMVKAMGRHAQHMALNYYPPCPQPELTYGLPGHKDPNAITLLLQDGVSGLQVQRDGRWVAVNPVPNALVINIGDQLQVYAALLLCVLCEFNIYRRSTSAILI